MGSGPARTFMKIFKVLILLFSILALMSGCKQEPYIDYGWQPNPTDLSKSKLPVANYIIKIKIKNKLCYTPSDKIFNNIENEMLIFIDGKIIANNKNVKLQYIKNRDDVINLISQLNECGIFSINSESIKSKEMNIKSKGHIFIIDGIDIFLTLNINDKEMHYDLSDISYFRDYYPEIKELQYLYKCYEILINKIPEIKPCLAIVPK